MQWKTKEGGSACGELFRLSSDVSVRPFFLSSHFDTAAIFPQFCGCQKLTARSAAERNALALTNGRGRGRTLELPRLNCQTHPEGPRAGGRAAGRGVGACHSTSRPPQRPPAPFHPRSLRPSISRNPSPPRRARPSPPCCTHIRNLVINGMRSLPRFLGAIHPES